MIQEDEKNFLDQSKLKVFGGQRESLLHQSPIEISRVTGKQASFCEKTVRKRGGFRMCVRHRQKGPGIVQAQNHVKTTITKNESWCLYARISRRHLCRPCLSRHSLPPPAGPSKYCRELLDKSQEDSRVS